MYPVSEQYLQSVKGSYPSYLTGIITFKTGATREIQNQDIASGGASITMQAVTQDVLEFGAAVLGQLDISVITDKTESRYKYYDAIIDLDYNVDLPTGTETIPLGIWTVSEAEREGTALKMSAYDNLIKFDKAYTLSLVGTPYDLMSTLASDCGCELAEDEDYYKTLPNGNLTLTINANSSCGTYRQAASIIAQMCGCFVQANRYGKISCKQFNTVETFSLNPSQRYHSKIADYVCKYVDLVVAGLGGSFRGVAENVVEGMTMYMEDAPAWDDGTQETLQAKADNLMLHLEQIQYTPCELLVPSDPSIDCGDLIALTTDNGTVYTLITSYTWNFHGQMELFSVGTNPYLLNNSANKQRVLRDIEVNGSGGSDPAALYTFKNTRKFKCSEKLEPLATVTFVATKDTFVMFNATFQVDVEVEDIEHKSSITVLDSNGTSRTYEVPYKRNGYAQVTIQYYYGGVEFGNPYTVSLETGSHVITLHYPVNAVAKDSINRFEVRMSATSEKMSTVSVAKEGFLGTISGQGLAGKPKWDGTINVEENIGTSYPISTIKVREDFDADVSITKLRRDDISGITERFGTASIMTISTLGFNSEVGVNRVITNYTFETSKASTYEFNRELVNYVNTFNLRPDYTYNSNEVTIDEGKMCSLIIPTDNKTSIESVDITNGREEVIK